METVTAMVKDSEKVMTIIRSYNCACKASMK